MRAARLLSRVIFGFQVSLVSESSMVSESFFLVSEFSVLVAESPGFGFRITGFWLQNHPWFQNHSAAQNPGLEPFPVDVNPVVLVT